MVELITGGSGSGKSAYAEDEIIRLRSGRGELVYIAAMSVADDETRERVSRHRRQRAGKGFRTIERRVNLKELYIPAGASVLLECMSNLTANEMFSEDGAKENTEREIIRGMEHLIRQSRNLVIVTNEIFSDGIEYDPETTRYIKALAALNRAAAAMADKVVEVVCAIPVVIKDSAKKGASAYEKNT